MNQTSPKLVLNTDSMDTPTLATGPGQQQFTSPLIVTGEAVRLRDRVYPLAHVGSARALRIPTDSFSVRVGIMALALVVGSLLVFIVRYLAEIAEEHAPLFYMADGYSYFTGASDNTLKTILVALALAGAICLFLAFKYLRPNQRYIYVASLRAPFWGTVVAASFEPGPVQEVVSAVNQALAHRDTPATEQQVYYSRDNAVTLGDTWLEVAGKSYPLSSIHYASSASVFGQPLRDYVKSFGLVGLLLGVLYALLTNFAAIATDPWGLAGLYIVGGLVSSVVVVVLNRRRGSPIGSVHGCKLDTSYDSSYIFISVDGSYTKGVVRAINKAVRHRDERTLRPSSLPSKL